MRFSTSREVWLELHRLYDGVSEDRAHDFVCNSLDTRSNLKMKLLPICQK